MECGNTYNLNCGCTVPVIAPCDLYYTKKEVDEKIDDIVISGGGVTSGEVQTMIEAAIADKADKADVYNKTEINAKFNDFVYIDNTGIIHFRHYE